MLRTLSQKVFATAGAFLALIAILALLTVASMFQVRATTANLSGDTVVRISVLNHIITAITHSHGETESFLRARLEPDRVEAENALAEAKEGLAQLDSLILGNRSIDTESARELVLIRDEFRVFVEDAETVIRAAPSAQAAETQLLLTRLEESADNLEEVHEQIDIILERDTRSITAITNTIAAETQRTLVLVAGLCVVCAVLVLLAVWMLRDQIVAPLHALSTATMSVTQGRLDQAIRVTGSDEIGQLQQNFNTMVTTIQQEMHHRDQQMAIAQAARSEAEAAHSAMSTQLATIETQQATIREMSVPILPLGGGTLVMPLIGALDSVRLGFVEEQALRTIERQAAQHFILDITGVPVIDTHAAQGLMRVIQAARLLGTEVMVVGIRPETAQTLVSLGIPFSGVATHSTLESGITQLLRRASR